MKGFSSSDDHQPLLWVRDHPIYAAHAIMLAFTASMIATALLNFLRLDQVLGLLQFDSAAVFRGQVWRVVTYGLVNHPSVWFAIDMLMIVWFGRELEKFFGRRIFLRFYGCLYLLLPALEAVIGLWRPTQLAGERGAFALFIAFATLYPNAAMLFNLLAKWVAIVLVGIFTLMLLSTRNGVELMRLWTTVGFAYVFVRYQQGRLVLPRVRLVRRNPESRSMPRPKSPAVPAPKPAAGDPMAEVDALLDKISRSGFGSLTPKERARLDEAREVLRKKEGGRGE